MKREADRKNDYLFKRIFGKEDTERTLSSDGLEIHTIEEIKKLAENE